MGQGQFTAADVAQPKGQFTSADIGTPAPSSGATGSWEPPTRAQEIGQGLKRAGHNLTTGLWEQAQPRTPLEQSQLANLKQEMPLTGGAIGHGLAFAGNTLDDLWKGTGDMARAIVNPQPESEGGGWAGKTLSVMENTPIIGGMVKKAEEGGPHMFSAPSLGAAAEGAGYAVAPEVADRTLTGIARIPGDIGAINDMRKYANQTGDPFKVALQSASHDILNKASDVAKKKLRDSEAMVSARVGGLKDDIARQDYAAGEPQIPMGDLIPKLDDLASRYKAAGGSLPKYDASTAALLSRTSPYMTFEEVAALRSEIGRNWSKAGMDADAAATSEIYKELTNKLSQRANDLGMGKQFQDYNGLWQTLRQYQKGPLGNLLDAPDGQSFFNILRDPKNGAALSRASDSLSDFGLDKNYLKSVAKDHAALHEFAKSSNNQLGFTGRFRALAQYPVIGGLGWAVGKSALGWPGGLLGTVGGANLADAVTASRDIRRLGGPLDTTGEMKQFTSQPSGQPLERPTPPDPQTKADLISALQSQGFTKQNSTAMAIQAMRTNPGADFGKLFNEAMRQKSVSGGSQAADPWANLHWDRAATDMASAEAKAGKLPKDTTQVQRAQQIKEAMMRSSGGQAARELPGGYDVQSYPWAGRTEYLVRDAKGKVVTEGHGTPTDAIEAAKKKINQ